jgi:hypothetical protein
VATSLLDSAECGNAIDLSELSTRFALA